MPDCRLLAVTSMILGVATACGFSPASGTGAKAADKHLAAPLDCAKNLSQAQMLNYQPPNARRRYKLALLEPALNGYYYQAVAYGAQQAAARSGVELTIVGGEGYTDPSEQLTDAENALNQGADALLLAPVDYQGAVPIVERAAAKNVPVINISTEVNSPKPYKILQDDYVQGQTSAKALVETAARSGGKGIVMGGPANATWSRRRVLGFKDELAKHPKFKIATVTNQEVDPSAGLTDFENAVQAHPNPDWIYSVYVYTLTPDSIPARYADIPYVTAGYEPMVINALKSGRVDATVTNVPTAMGRLGVGTAVSVLNGERVPRGITCLPNDPLTRLQIGSQVANAELYPPGYRAKG